MQKNSNNLKMITTTAIIAALSIVIIYVVPSIPVGLVTVTLSSHTPVVLSMFISPISAACVSIISALGYLIKGLPPVVFFRAMSHIVWAVLGAFLFKNLFKSRDDFKKPSKWFKFTLYAIVLNVIHAALECIIVYLMVGVSSYATLWLFILNVGVVTGVHGLIDFFIGVAIYAPIFPILKKQ